MSNAQVFQVAFQLGASIDSSMRRAFQQANSNLGAMETQSSVLNKSMKGLAATAAVAGAAFLAVGAGLKGAVSAASEYDQAMRDIQVTTGATNTQMAEMKKISKNLYNQNFGEDWNDLAEAVSATKSVTQLTGKELEGATKNALIYRDAFKAEIPESIKVADTMMKNFGITNTQSFNLLAQGAQKGLDKSGELLDSANEYAPQFAALGFNANEMFDTFSAGLKSGAFNLDKVGDAVKEFNIRSKDGSKASAEAYRALGLDAGKMTEIFAAGGPTAKKAYDTVVNAISQVQDPAKKTAISVGLFGTQAEDLESTVIAAMGSARKQFDMTKDTMESIGDIKYASLSAFWQGMGRQIETGLVIPIGEKVLPVLNKFANATAAYMPIITKALESGLGKVGAVVSSLPALFSGTSEGMVKFQSILTKAFGQENGLKIINLFLKIKDGVDLVEPYFAKAKGLVTGLISAFQGNTGKSASILSMIGLSPETVFQVQSIVSQIVEEVKFRFGALKEVASGVGKFFVAAFEYLAPIIIPGLKAVLDFAGGVLGKIRDFWESDGQHLMKAVSNIFIGILAVIKFVMPVVLGIIKMVWGNIKGVINGALNIIMGAVKIFSGLFTGDFGKMWEGVKQLFKGAVEFIWNFIQLTFYGKILGGVKGFVLSFRGFITDLWGGVVALFKGGGNQAMITIQVAWQSILRLTKGVFTGILSFFKSTWSSIQSVFNGAISLLKNIILGGFGFIRNVTSTIFGGIWTFLRTIWTTVTTFIQATIAGLISRFVSGFMNIFNTTRNVFTGIWNFLRTIWTSVTTFIQATIAGLISRFVSGFMNIFNTTRNVFNGIWSFLKTIWDTIRIFVSGSVDNIFNKVRNVWSSIKSTTSRVFGDIFNTIKGRFTDIVDAAKALPGRIGDGIGKMASKVTSGVTKVINTLASTLGKGVNGVIGGINWVLGKLGVDEKSHVDLWTVPQYAMGTRSHPGGPAILGDGGGAEMYRTPAGRVGLSPATDTLMNLPKGTQVIPARETRMLMNQLSIPAYNTGTAGGTVKAGMEWLGNKFTAGKDYVSEKAGAGKDYVVEKAGALKDAALDVFSYLSNPSGLMTKILDQFGIAVPSMPGALGEIAGGGFKKVKESGISFLKSKLDGLKSSFSSVSLTGGNGGGFGAPFRLTSAPGPRSTGIAGASRLHKGWDWAAPSGTPIPSVSGGTVSRNSWHPLSGNFVEVRSGNQIHRYQHNSRNAVSVGQQVAKGQTVGYVGSTGVSSGPHLHYEVKRAYAKGGQVPHSQYALVGEDGPEIAKFPGGARITSNKNSNSLLSRIMSFGKEEQFSATTNVERSAPTFNFSAHVTVEGNADQSVIETALTKAEEKWETKFKELYRKMEDDRRRLSFE